MVEHLAKVAAIHPFAAHRASIQILGFAFGRIVLPARELNDRAVLFSHLVPPMREPEYLTESGAGSVVIYIVSQQITTMNSLTFQRPDPPTEARRAGTCHDGRAASHGQLTNAALVAWFG